MKNKLNNSEKRKLLCEKTKVLRAGLNTPVQPPVQPPENTVVSDGFTAIHKKLIMLLAAAGLAGVLVKANCSDDRQGQGAQEDANSAEVQPQDMRRGMQPDNQRDIKQGIKRPERVPAANDAVSLELQTDRLIERAEKTMAKLTGALRQKGASSKDTDLMQKLLEPMDLVKINQKNANRNGPKFHRLARERGQSGAWQEDINYFSYSSGKKGGFAASYEPPTRVMNLAADFEEDNLLDGLILHHELRHVMQDTQLRTTLNSEQDFRKYLAMNTNTRGQPPKMFLMEEASAYMYEIEALNLLLDGELKAAHAAGREIDLQQAQLKLKARLEQQGMIKMLFELAGLYYRSGSGANGITAKFLADLAAFHRKQMGQGLDFYESSDFRNLKKWGE